MNIIVATRGVDHATNHDQHPSLPSANIVSLKYSSKHSNSNFSKLCLSHHLGYCIGRNFQTIFKNTTKIFHLQSIRNIPLQVSALGFFLKPTTYFDPGSCMGGSKRGSAGVESLAGEGVGEEEFLARFNLLYQPTHSLYVRRSINNNPSF